LRDAQHLAAVEVIESAIVLTMMRFGDELVDTGQFDFPATGAIRKNELDMAKALVNSLAAGWDPSKYTDEYRDNLMRVIKAKMKGKKIEVEAEPEPREAKVVDLMERLRQSLAQGKKSGAKRAAATAKRGTKKTAARKRTRAA
jgi:DNA end-binding protein Ku